jgi:hypothetical protein
MNIMNEIFVDGVLRDTRSTERRNEEFVRITRSTRFLSLVIYKQSRIFIASSHWILDFDLNVSGPFAADSTLETLHITFKDISKFVEQASPMKIVVNGHEQCAPAEALLQIKSDLLNSCVNM